ncbi:MAG TPA: hypothetical protein VN653_14520 [Anaerolineales bacterium]|nr:hypothetical protein [Anaerolineales bacterium]
MKQSDSYQANAMPNIHISENERVLAYLKDLHPYNEIIVPFAEKKVNQDITASGLVGHFAAMPTLPLNSKYVVYGTEVFAHPATGIIFGFITGVSVIYRLPDNLLKEVRESDIVNFRVVKESGIDHRMENLESNWVISQSITEQLVHKCFEYYGQTAPEEAAFHLNFDLDLTTPRTREFEQKEQSRRVIALGFVVAACILLVLVWYAVNYFTKFL